MVSNYIVRKEKEMIPMKQDPGLELTSVKFNSIYDAKYDRDIDSSSIIVRR